MKKSHLPTFAETDALIASATLTQADLDAIDKQLNGLFIVNGKVKTLVGKRSIKQNIAFIDYINFTVKIETFRDDTIEQTIEATKTRAIVIYASKVLFKIFGFGITVIRPTGLNFYERSYELGNKYGHFCEGGQNFTALISISGVGLAQATEGWENRLFIFLKSASQANITRIDLAHDDFDASTFSVDHCLSEFMKGSFKNGKRQPTVTQAGNWIQPDGKGRTLYIGKRTNGLFVRIYEKGLQLGSTEKPNWVRCEVELKAIDRIIPFEVLLRPHHYLAGSFPIFNQLNKIQTRVETYQHEVKADLAHREKWGKRQSGGFINLLSQLGYTDTQIIEKLKGKKVPKAFQQKFLENNLSNVHQVPSTLAHPNTDDTGE